MRLPIPISTIPEAARQVSNEAVGLFPFDTIWGITGLLTPSVVSRIQTIKGRAADQPFIVLLETEAMVSRLMGPPEDWQLALLRRYWPGPVTFVLPKAESVPMWVTGGRSTVAVRCPSAPWVREFLRAVGGPVVSTSFNRSGQPPVQFSEFLNLEGTDLDFVYSGLYGILPLVESAVVDLTVRGGRVVRAGLLAQSEGVSEGDSLDGSQGDKA